MMTYIIWACNNATWKWTREKNYAKTKETEGPNIFHSFFGILSMEKSSRLFVYKKKTNEIPPKYATLKWIFEYNIAWFKIIHLSHVVVAWKMGLFRGQSEHISKIWYSEMSVGRKTEHNSSLHTNTTNVND